MVNGKLEIQQMNEFNIKTNEVEFLFNNEVPEYIKAFYKKAFRLKYVTDELNHDDLSVGERRTKLAQEKSDLFGWFGDQFDVSKNLFKKYLGFKK